MTAERVQADSLRAWMMDESFPLWAGAGIHESGAAREALDFDGRPVPNDEARVRVQARQLYSYSLAHGLGWDAERSRAIVTGLLDILTRVCRRPDGLYGRRINLEKQALIDDTPDLYDNAFALLALVSARSVLGGKLLDRPIGELLGALDEHSSRDSGGFCEFLPAPAFRLQNPHMHLFESTLALYAATGDDAVRDRALTLNAFIEDTFFNTTVSCVNEFGDPVQDDQKDFFEPGHSMEWVWLLGWRARLLREPYPEFGRRLYERALATLDREGRALMSVSSSGAAIDASRRLWSQTETLKAHLCMMEHGVGDAAAQAAARAAQCGQSLLGEWLRPAASGGWLDHFDADDKLVAKNMPASSGYHVYCAIAELMRLT